MCYAHAAAMRRWGVLPTVSLLSDARAEVVLRRDPDGELRACVLEVNPLAPAADPGHFSWAGGADYRLVPGRVSTGVEGGAVVTATTAA